MDEHIPFFALSQTAAEPAPAIFKTSSQMPRREFLMHLRSG